MSSNRGSRGLSSILSGKTPLLTAVSILLAVGVATSSLLLQPSILNAAERGDQWKEVDEAVNKGLPKTAIEMLEPIIAGALEDKAYAEAIRAIGKRISLEGNIQGNKPEEIITRMEAEIEEAPGEMKPVMTAILANWYWHYFQQNRWRFLRRTQTAQAPSKDFTTWDLPRLFREIDKPLQTALAAADELKQIPVQQYDELLEKGTMPDNYRPTLYDFLAYNALEFYQSGEQAGAKAQDHFSVMADSPIFSTAADFIAWEPVTTDEDSIKLKAIRLYQDLLKFHQNDDDPGALIDADLHRLVFGFNSAFGEEKNARYKAALKRLANKWSEHPISSRALYHQAAMLRAENEYVRAHAVATQGKNAYPNSLGGRMCHNLIQQIIQKNVDIKVERVWNAPFPKINVTYKNLSKVHFRVVRQDWTELMPRRNWQPEELDHNQKKALLGRPAVMTFDHNLPATPDYKHRLEQVPTPEDLAPGFYWLISSHNAQFSMDNNSVRVTGFWVSDLALVIRTRSGTPKLSGFVLSALTGEPIASAKIRSWLRQRDNSRTSGPSTRTDNQGLFEIETGHRRGVSVLAEHDGHSISSYSDSYVYSQDHGPKPFERTVFFTDRTLYRPGQTIQFKGLCIAVDQRADSYKVIPGRNVTVMLNDRNGKKVESLNLRTNDYGSVSGSFTAPRDRLTGRMTIFIEEEDGPKGSTTINVEEYKRPKFEVTLDKAQEATKLNDKVSLRGNAKAYTGASIGGARVRFRVVRQVRYPYWWSWRYWWRTPVSNTSQEIAHGFATTEGDGSFKITLTAKPDLSVPESDEPSFHFQIHADVTDTNGETRSASSGVTVGYKALRAIITVDPTWLTDEAPSRSPSARPRWTACRRRPRGLCASSG